MSTPMPGGGVEPLDSRRSWPFAAALTAFVVGLGLLPHLRFSLLLGEPLHFFSAYDEPAYTIWAFEGGGPFLPHRWLSSAVLVTLSRLVGGSWGLALVLADVVFPALAALLVWQLVGFLTHRRLLRLALGLCLLFAQELFSLGCWTVWQLHDPLAVPTPDSGFVDLRDLRAHAPDWIARLWPDYTTPYLMLFRTPDPQIGLVILYALVLLLLGLCRAAEARETRPRLVAAAALNVALFASYFFVASAVVVLEMALATALWAWGRRGLARQVALLASLGTVSALVGVLAFHGGAAQGYSFASRLPVLTPASLAAAIGLVTLFRLRRPEGGGELLPLATACFASVLMLTNQQLVTGRMISTRDWERSVDYPLVVLGAMLAASGALRLPRERLHVVYASLGAFLVVVGGLLVKAQDRVFEQEFLVANLKSLALTRALLSVEAQGLREHWLLLEDPELDLILEARLERRLRHLLDLTPVFEKPIDALTRTGGGWGRRSPFQRDAFEYFARRPRTPAAVERLLAAEAEAGSGTFLRFFFDPRDFWTTITDERAARLADVRAEVPRIRDAYEAYLAAGDPCWSRPVVVLTRQNAAERTNPRWRERLLVEATVGRDRPLMNMHAYLQEPAAGIVTPAAGACP